MVADRTVKALTGPEPQDWLDRLETELPTDFTALGRDAVVEGSANRIAQHRHPGDLFGTVSGLGLRV